MKYPYGPKSDWLRQAKGIVDGTISLAQEELPNLLEWLKDYNWPGAKEIAEFLVHFKNDLVEPVRHVLKSADYVWVYWILAAIVSKWPSSTCLLIADELRAIAYGYDEEGAHIEALRICINNQLDPAESIRKAVMIKSQTDSENAEEYQQILSVLQNAGK